jgi:DNA-binding transcriptional ArsR family regulator
MDRYVRERAGALFAALGHPTRLRIVELLLSQEKTVNEIATTLGVLQSGTSQHLAVLTRAGVLVVEQRGASRFYRVRGPRVARILALIEEFCTVHNLYGAEDAPEPSDENVAPIAVPIPASVKR